MELDVQSVLEEYKAELANANHDRVLLRTQLKAALDEIEKLKAKDGSVV